MVLVEVSISCTLLVLCIKFCYSCTCTRSKEKQKTQQTNTAEQEPKDLCGSAMCLHPWERAAPHHHIDHEITSSIQATTSFDLSWFLFFKTSHNHLAHYLPFWTLSIAAAPLFCSLKNSLLMHYMIKSIYTL